MRTSPYFPTSVPSLCHQHAYLTSSNVCAIYKNSLRSFLNDICMCLCIEPSTVAQAASYRPHPWRKLSFILHYPSTTNNFSDRGGTKEAASPFLGFCWLLLCMSFSYVSWQVYLHQTFYCRQSSLPLVQTPFILALVLNYILHWEFLSFFLSVCTTLFIWLPGPGIFPSFSLLLFYFFPHS